MFDFILDLATAIYWRRRAAALVLAARGAK